MKGARDMVDNKNIILTEEDKEMIDSLKVAPLLKIANIGRRNRVENILSIEDLSAQKLKDLLPKIDLYINELYTMHLGIDEMWVMQYYALKDSINKKLKEN
ncbi:hypothetical protein FDC45_11240 [Clostridium botulinum]|uniref:Uncharacterized protein n=3 Tax=Clostridium botulinum TaxID=1491 RepID=A0A846JC86_CLOBO|nr:hypothetical protein CLK_A0090 [Clostridium botulinum A3 str. Loch Maree]NFH65073.1 hypothetical protein [Clostridium botulinum]NFJ09473.1 hypothetical protein [Clostridium botulinum]NFK16705.1 hypothetical protein [Clostridium botulinum]NFM93582.1 hypothetical protein [Clostridium botulinum]